MGMHQMLGPISGSGDPDPIDVTRSLRFTSGDSAYLSRTPSSAGNRRTWTWSGWVKRSALGATQGRIFGGGTSDYFDLYFPSGDELRVLWTGNNLTTTTALFRDTSAWYHIVLAVDTTQSTAADRIKIYVNGTLQARTATNPSQNYDTAVNNTVLHTLGRYAGSGSTTYFDGYLANVQFIDGEALEPSKFGILNDDNVWVPVEYSDSYGTNGFYLQFNSTTTSALGDDTSGNNNDYTPNNLTGTDAKLFVDKKPDGNNWGNIANAFDGNTSTYADGTYNNGTTSTITFNPPITGVTSLRVYWYGTSNYGYNGSNVGTGSTTAEYKSLYSGSAITVNSIQGTSQPGNGVVRIYAIEVNGSVLTGYSRGTPTVIDSVFDSPTNLSQTDTGAGGEVSGNYATMNPIGKTKSVYFVQDGNLKTGNSSVASGSSGNRGFVPSTIGFKTGKWYCECVTTKASDGDKDFAIGIFPADSTGYYSTSGHYAVRQEGTLFSPAGVNQSYGTSFGDGDVIGIAVDMDSSTKTVQWFKNGTAIASATTIVAKEYFFGYGSDGGGGGRTYTSEWNFGQRSFSYNAPSGFKALCTANLPTPPIADGSTAMDVVTYTGNSSSRSITTNFSPDLVWLKSRASAFSHYLGDIVRGNTKLLRTNTSAAEITSTTGITSFDSDGFSLGNGSETNANGDSMVAWAWDAGSSTVSNTDGSITSYVRANPSAGFSIVSYAGNSTNGATVGHGLNAKPDFIILKARTAGENWFVNFPVGTGDGYLMLNQTSGGDGSNSTVWNSTDPTSSVFTLGTSNGVNGGQDYIAYCFAPVAGYSAFGSYTGNGSANGPFVYTGMRPAWLLLKESSSSGELWTLYDSTRNSFNVAGKQLYPSLSNAEADASADTHARVDFLSNGFKIRGSHSSINTNGETIVYYAFAEHPFKTARAR